MVKNLITLDSGAKQGNVLSSMLFKYVINWIMERIVSTHEEVAFGNVVKLTNLEYDDNVTPDEEDPEEDSRRNLRKILSKVVCYSDMVDNGLIQQRPNHV